MNLGSKSKDLLYRGRYTSALLSGAASAHVIASETGYWWLTNKLSSPHIVAVRRLLFASPIPAAQATAVARVAFSKTTTTADPSGTAGTPVGLDSAESLPSTIAINTTSTGLALTDAGLIAAGVLGQTLEATPTGAVTVPQLAPVFDDAGDLNRALLLRAGEGIVCWLADNGDTDQRAITAVDFEVYKLYSA